MTDNAQSELHFFMTSSSSSQSSSSPSCLKWARTLSSLLEDRDGVELFKRYVELEGGIHSDRLKFYFACEGLKQQSDTEKVNQIIGAIYRFLKKSQLTVPEDIRQTIKAGLKDKNFVLTPDLFDQMQADIERIINETTYPHFLQSEMYLQFVQNYQSAIERAHTPGGSIATTNTTTVTSSTISEASSKFLSRSSTLPTLHEEGDGTMGDGSDSGACGGYSETSNRVPTLSGSSSSKPPMSLTKDALMATQRRRLEMRAPGYVSPHRLMTMTDEGEWFSSMIPRRSHHKMVSSLKTAQRFFPSHSIFCARLKQIEFHDEFIYGIWSFSFSL